MTCQPSTEKPLAEQLRAMRQSEMYEEMQVRLSLYDLKLAVKKLRETRAQIDEILVKIEEKKKNRKESGKNEEKNHG